MIETNVLAITVKEFINRIQKEYKIINSKGINIYENWKYLEPNMINYKNDKYVICLTYQNKIIAYATLSTPFILAEQAIEYYGQIPTFEISFFEVNKQFQGNGLSKQLIKGIDDCFDNEIFLIEFFSNDGLSHHLPENFTQYIKNNIFISKQLLLS